MANLKFFKGSFKKGVGGKKTKWNFLGLSFFFPNQKWNVLHYMIWQLINQINKMYVFVDI